MSESGQWWDRSWNPVTGCTPCSEGCEHCWARAMAKRLRGRAGYPADEPFRVTFHPDRLDQPLHWRRPQRIFVCDMGDLFHPDVDRGWIASVRDAMNQARQHRYFLLTKRVEWMADLFLRFDSENWQHVWLGATVENQPRADERLPHLLKLAGQGWHTFVSAEPLLGPIDLAPYIPIGGPQWVIVGGETGPGARPMHPDWVRSIRDQCVAAGVPFFLKHLGEWRVEPGEGQNYVAERVGRKAAGRMLDGRTWEEVPNG